MRIELGLGTFDMQSFAIFDGWPHPKPYIPNLLGAEIPCIERHVPS